MLQTRYGYTSQRNVPGGLADSSPNNEIVSRANAETDSTAIHFGMGVVRGDIAGENIKLPVAASTAALFEGVVLTTQMELGVEGEQRNPGTRMLNVLESGKAWVLIPEGLEVAYGDPVHLIKDGADAGRFTKTSGTNAIALKGRFIGKADSGDIAPIHLYNVSHA